MAIVSQNIVPPPPPLHHHPAHLADGPHTIPTQAPGPMTPMHLADQNVNQRPPHGTYQEAGDSTSLNELYLRAPYFQGYTFFKAEASPGHKSSWSHVQKTKMNLSQADLLRLAQSKDGKSAPAQSYQSLSKYKRMHVDQLIGDHRRVNPRFEWTCVYIKEETKPTTGKGYRRGDYETVSMDIVLVRKPAPVGLVGAETPTQFMDRHPTDFDGFVTEDETRPTNNGFDTNPQWTGPVVNPSPVPGIVDHAQQPVPLQLHQNTHPAAQGNPVGEGYIQHPVPLQLHQNPHPAVQGHPVGEGYIQHPPPLQLHPNLPPVAQEHPVGEGYVQHPPPLQLHPNLPPVAQGHPVREDQYGNQVPWEGVHQQPEMYNAARVGPRNGPAFETRDRGAIVTHGHNQFDRNAMYTSERGTIHKYRNINQGNYTPSSSNSNFEPEAHWPHDSDDESLLFEREYQSSATEGTDYLEENHEDPRSSCGSLFRGPSTSKPPQVYGARHQKNYNNNTFDLRRNHNRYSAGYIEVVPAKSKQSSRRLARAYTTQKVIVQPQSRPKIIQGKASSDDLSRAYLRGRERNNFRSQMLDDREARLEQRERMVDYMEGMADELRRMSLRRSSPDYSHPSRYYT